MATSLLSQEELTPGQFMFLKLYHNKAEVSKDIIVIEVKNFGWDNDDVNHFLTELHPKYLERVFNSQSPMTFRLTDFGLKALANYIDPVRVIGLCRRAIYRDGHIAYPQFLRQTLSISEGEDYEIDLKMELLSSGEFKDRPTKGCGSNSYISRNNAFIAMKKTENYNFENVRNFAKDVSGNVNQESTDLRPQTNPTDQTKKSNAQIIIKSVLIWTVKNFWYIISGVIIVLLAAYITDKYKLFQ